MKYIAFVIALLFFVGCAHVSTPISETDKQKISGSWIGQLEIPNGPLPVEFRFETDKDGELVGLAYAPDQNAYNMPVTGIKFAGGTLSLSVPSVPAPARYKGEMTGDVIVGKLSLGGSSFSLTLKKGPAYGLDLSPKAMAQLLGEWHGGLNPSLPVIFRFERTESGSFKGFVDSPNQGARGIPISEATFADGQLEIKVKAVGGEYKGRLSGNNLSGNWKQMGASNTLTLTKK